MPLWLEKTYPFLIGFFAGLAWYVFDGALPSDTSSVFSAGLTLGAILTGFLATSKAILISLNGTPVMIKLKKSTYINELVTYLAHAIWLAFAYSIVSMTGFFITNPQAWNFGEVWISIGTASGLAFIRVTLVILQILKLSDKE